MIEATAPFPISDTGAPGVRSTTTCVSGKPTDVCCGIAITPHTALVIGAFVLAHDADIPSCQDTA